MSRTIQVLVVAVLLLAGLQWFLPRWVANQMAAQIAVFDHGPKPNVALTAIPFWYLLEGNFQDLYVSAHQVTVGPVELASVQVDWQNGGLSTSALTHQQLKVTRVGKVALTITVDETALAKFLAQQGKFQNPTVHIQPSGVAITGRVLLGGVYIPLDTQGNLVVSPDKKSLIFHPTSIDGVHLPVVTDVQIFNVNSLKLPVPMVIHSVILVPGAVIVKAGTP